MATDDHVTATIADMVVGAQHLLVLTGAGISASAGVNTFRGTGAPPARLLPAMHAHTWREHVPEITAWWGAMHHTLAAIEPTAAHRALADIEHHRTAAGRSTTVITQNVDGLHTRAGSSDVLELHGRIDRAAIDPETGDELPRPDVVFFGEQIHHRDRYEELARTADAVLVIGTSGNVWPVAGLPSRIRSHGGAAALINIDPWPAQVMQFDHWLHGPADDLVPTLLNTP